MITDIPEVSIVIPAYNQERHITETIQYFLEQTYTNWELIIVDDQSTDETKAILERFSSLDNRVRVFVRDRDPKGAQTCRTIGLTNARGKYFMLSDSDDIIRPYCIEQRVSFMDANPHLDYAVFRGGTYNEQTKKTNHNRWGIEPQKDLLTCFLEADYPFSWWNMIMKTEVARDILFDEKLQVYQDFDFIIRALLKKYTFCFVKASKTDYYYRIGNQGTISSGFISEGKYESTKYLFSKTLNELQSLSDYEERKKQFFQFFLLQLKRVAVNGSKDQLNDYFRFLLSNYKSSEGTLKIRLAQLLLNEPFQGKGSREKYVQKVISNLFDDPYIAYKKTVNHGKTTAKKAIALFICNNRAGSDKE